MPHSLPHPYRVLELLDIANLRAADGDTTFETVLFPPTPKSGHLTLPTDWVVRNDTDGVPDFLTTMFTSYHAALWELASEVAINSQPVPEIYDVSALLGKLPEQDIATFVLSGLVIPAGNTFFVQFGSRDRFLLNTNGKLTIEGAYVEQRTSEDRTRSEFNVTLVCDDPDNATKFGRQFTETMRNYVIVTSLRIGADETVAQALRNFELGSNFIHPVLKENIAVCLSAFEATIKAMIYLETRDRDVELGCISGGDPVLREQALDGDHNALTALLLNGTPMVKLVGRFIRHVSDLQQPDFHTRYAEEIARGR